MNQHQIDAKKYLSQGLGLNSSIERNLNQIRELRDIATKITVSYSDMPRNPNKGNSKIENPLVKVMDLQAETDKTLMELLDLKQDIIKRINEMEEPELQMVLTFRYVNCLPWNKISEHMGCSVDNVYVLHRKALGKINIP